MGLSPPPAKRPAQEASSSGTQKRSHNASTDRFLAERRCSPLALGHHVDGEPRFYCSSCTEAMNVDQLALGSLTPVLGITAHSAAYSPISQKRLGSAGSMLTAA